MLPARSRSLFFLAFLTSSGVFCATLYLQFSVALYPCSLYQVQRFFIGGFALVCMAATVHGAGRTGSRVYAIVALCMALAGSLAAVRQLWLQGRSLAPESLCRSDLQCLWNSQPMAGTLQSLLLGDAQCARVNWSLLDMTWPEWSLLAFVAMLVFCALQLIQRSRPRATGP